MALIRTRDTFCPARTFARHRKNVFEVRPLLKMNLFYFEVNRDILEIMNKQQFKLKDVKIK